MPRLGRRTILINSATRANASASTTTNFRFPFPQKINNVIHANLLSAVVENGVYNVVNGVNDQFRLITNFGTGSQASTLINIPAGYYDVVTLAVVLGIALNANNPVQQWLVNGTLRQDTFLVEVLPTGFVQFINDIMGNWAIDFNGFPETAKLLGFLPLVYNCGLTAYGPFYTTGPNPIRLTNYDMVLIQSSQLSFGNNLIETNQGFNAWISILNGNQQTNSTTITFLNVRPPTLDVQNRYARDIEWVDIRLCDIYGQELDIGTNNVQLLVELYIDLDLNDLNGIR